MAINTVPSLNFNRTDTDMWEESEDSSNNSGETSEHNSENLDGESEPGLGRERRGSSHQYRVRRSSTNGLDDEEDNVSVDFSGPRYRYTKFVPVKRNLNELKQEIEGAFYKQTDRNFRDNKYEQEEHDSDDYEENSHEDSEVEHDHRHSLHEHGHGQRHARGSSARQHNH